MFNENTNLPDGWFLITLCQLGEWSSGGTPSRSHSEYYGGDIPWIKTGNLPDGLIEEIDENITWEGLANSSAKVFPKNSLIVAMYGATIGKLGILKESAATNQACAALLSKGLTTEIIPYVFYYLLNRREHLRSIGQGGAQPNISQTVLKEYPCPLPPLNEQRRIVAKIEALKARSQRVKEEIEAIAPLLDQFRQSVLAAAFRGELTADWRKQNSSYTDEIHTATVRDYYSHKITAPRSWKKYAFKEVCKLIGGSQPPKKHFINEPQNSYIRLIQIRDYKSDKFATYIPLELARRFCSKEDIMIGRYGPPIFQILRGLEGAYNVALMKAEPDLGKIDKEFLYYYLQIPELFNYVAAGSLRTAGQDGVRKEHLDEYPIFLPAIEEQQEIVRRIETFFKAAHQVKQQYQESKAYLDQLNQSILAKAFRGELVPQDPNDEPASVLLERIRAEREKLDTKKKAKGKTEKKSRKAKPEAAEPEQLSLPGFE